MFFVISKILGYLLRPVLWILILFIIGLLTKKPKRKKYFIRSSLILLIIFSNPFVLIQFARWWDVKPAKLAADSNYSCAIVLGGYGSEDANKDGYFNASADRFIQAVKLKAEGRVSHLLITGGTGRLFPTDFRESDWVLSQLRDLKIPDSSILIEDRSRNSYENAVFSKRMFDSMSLKPPYLLITSAYHMRRARYIYKKQGLDVIAYPCNYLEGRGAISFSDFIPSGSALNHWEFYIREVVGYAVYAIKGN